MDLHAHEADDHPFVVIEDKTVTRLAGAIPEGTTFIRDEVEFTPVFRGYTR